MPKTDSFHSAPNDAPAGAEEAGSLRRNGLSVAKYFGTHTQAAIFPLTAGLLFYGWRAAVVIVIVMGSAAIGIAIWRKIGRRGAQLHFPQGLWLALLLGLMLPAHLGSNVILPYMPATPLWPILPAAGLVLVILMWIQGVARTVRLHPAILACLLLAMLFGSALTPRLVLQRGHLLSGDLLKAGTSERPVSLKDPWIVAPPIPDQDAIHTRAASTALTGFSNLNKPPNHANISLIGLLRDRVPPLEDLIIGGQPAPIGAGSAIAVIIGGLFLLYRGMIDYKIPLLIVLSAWGAMFILPIPADIANGYHQWRWLVMRDPHVGRAAAITFIDYQIFAGPLFFMAFFLATAAFIRPLTRRARMIYAVLIGLAAAFFQLYFSVAYGPYLALLLIGLIAPLLDALFKPQRRV